VTVESAPFYRGPYILHRDTDGALRFYPAKQVKTPSGRTEWVALTPEEIEAQTANPHKPGWVDRPRL
jgi:hypothetical protein